MSDDRMGRDGNVALDALNAMQPRSKMRVEELLSEAWRLMRQEGGLRVSPVGFARLAQEIVGKRDLE